MKRVYFLLLSALLLANPALAAEVVFETNKGKMVFFIDTKKAPVSAENFLQYARDGFFDNTIFHRVIPNFVIQGGGFLPTMKPKPTRAPIQNESANGLKNKKYTLSMARTNDPHSATSQFFINLSDNAPLDPNPAQNNAGYAVFGFVSEGQEVVDAIAAVPTGNVGRYRDVPTEPIVVSKASVIGE